MSDNLFRAPEGSEELDAVNYAAAARERGAPSGQIELARLTRPAFVERQAFRAYLLALLDEDPQFLAELRRRLLGAP